MEENSTVLCEIRDRIAWITLNRPGRLNALDGTVLKRLAEILDRVGYDKDVQAAVLTGAGEKAFSAGADIRFLSTASPLAVRGLARQAVEVNRLIEDLGKVTVAAINGFALGGGLELAEACTLRVAASTARMGHPEVRIGAVAGWGGTTRLPRLVGPGRAAEILLTGRLVSAEEAERIGLVNRVTKPDELLAAAGGLVQEIIANAPVAVSLTGEAMRRGLDLSVGESLLLGADLFGIAASTDDFREGTRAFLEKRQPDFRGQ